MKKLLLLITLISTVALSSNVNAKETETIAPETKVEVSEQTGALKGIVFDKITNESIAGAVVTANGQKVYTDLDGNFVISNICSGKCKIKITMISYEDKTMELDVLKTGNIEIKLSQR